MPSSTVFDEATFSDDALRIATRVRRTPASDSSDSRYRRMFPFSASCESNEAQRHRKPDWALVGASHPHAETRLASTNVPGSRSRSTSDVAISTCRQLSRKPISEGGLGPYFLTEVFRRAGLEESLKGAGQNVPVSFQSIAHLSVSKCDDPTARCSICLMGFSSQETMLPCAHVFHTKCVVPWLHVHNSCPCCRAPVESLPAPHSARMFLGHCTGTVMEHENVGVRELASRMMQWDGMTTLSVALVATSAETLTSPSAGHKRKRSDVDQV